ncbi:MAG: hypothetical protein AAF352_08545 [Pseudomonadota bacterium]
MTEASTDKTADTPKAAPRNQWWDVWDQFKSHKGAMAGFIVFMTIVPLWDLNWSHTSHH